MFFYFSFSFPSIFETLIPPFSTPLLSHPAI
jgi:hypothetical protein